ncbi:MAG: DUF58 domain-containing protein [Alphaproteobacteria bacterium]|nr:DUF58 domain-containing protein [Alphaproteobacteria bacterium]
MAAADSTLKAQHRAEHLASKFPSLLIAAERVATTVAQGVHGRRRVGQGETFWQFRRYEPGDQTTNIDWRQSAKSRYVFVRETEWEAAQSAWLWRDTSPSMDYQSGPKVETKRARADLLLLALAALLMRGGERFTLLNTGILPATGRAAYNRLTASILDDIARDADRDTDTADTGLSLPKVELLPRYGQVVLLGDFLSPLSEIQDVILALAGRGVRGQMMQILDPAEETLPFRGRIRFDGFEGEGQTLLSRVETVRQDYHGRLEDHWEGLATIAKRVGWGFSLHRTDRPPESALLSLYTALAPEMGA